MINLDQQNQTDVVQSIGNVRVNYFREVKSMPTESQDDVSGTRTANVRLEKALAELQGQLTVQSDEQKLKQFLDAAIPEFESLYREARSAFTTDVVTQLQDVRACQSALQEFIEICEDIADVRSKEEARELKDRLRDISSHFENYPVCGRIEKEYRGLSQALVTLPSESDAKTDVKLNSRIAQLNGDPPECRKCGSPMVLHLGRSTPFWGCSTFPKCYSRKWLTKKQRRFLGLQ